MTEARDGEPEFVVVGHVSKPHGTKGEVYVWSLTDRPASTFQPDLTLLVADGDGRDPDPDLPALRLVAARPYRKGFLVLFEGIHDRDGADTLRDRYLLRRLEDTEPLAEGEIFYHQVLGLRVVTTDGNEVGRVTEVFEVEPAALLEVEGPSRSFLIPFTNQVVLACSVEDGTIVIDPPQGLLDL